MKRVVHITSVHTWDDNRIFYRECSSLAKNGYTVYYIVPTEGGKKVNHVNVVPIAKRKNHITRFLSTFFILRVVLQLKIHLIHIHDFELIPLGLILKIFRKTVIYDVHEDNVSVVYTRTYVPMIFKKLLSCYVYYVERLIQPVFHIIIAEKYYKYRFKKSLPILNYPVVHEPIVNVDERDYQQGINLLYSGKITAARGALIHAEIPRLLPKVVLVMVGKCALELASEMYRIAGNNRKNLVLEGIGQFVNPDRIRNLYKENKWLAGLAIFPKNHHYERKELTKFFEYMLAGLPIICSNFPVWKNFVSKYQCGMVVNPEDPQDIKEKIEFLANDLPLAKRLGKNGQKAVIQHFNWSREETKLLQLYEQLT